VESKMLLVLPDRPSDSSPSGAPVPQTAVLVGERAARNGLRPLLQAWELVEGRCPAARLHVVGAGPLSGDVARWASARPESREFHGQLPQREVLQLLPTCTSLVAPSIRSGRWREQIGLPIKEALRSGLTVVTTTETGLASWLRVHGHQVVEAPFTVQQLSDAIVEALQHPLLREQVLSALPAVSARLEADRWLHSVTT
jgi:glycosyltransferase involved in cell wall biosynthesis